MIPATHRRTFEPGRSPGRSGRRSRRASLLGGLALVVGVGLFGCLAPNQPPIASFTRTPSSGPAPLSVVFDASACVDPDGIIATYHWAFGDGATATGPSATHTYSTAGAFTVALTVTDDDGATGRVDRTIVVANLEAAPPPTGAEVGQMAPEFTLDDLDGNPISLSDLRGRVVLLEFWATTCGACRLTMPHLEMLRAEYAADGLVVVAVSIDRTGSVVREYVETNGYSEFIVAHGSESEARAVKARYGVSGVPHTFVIDRQGVVRHHDHPIRLRARHIEPWL